MKVKIKKLSEAAVVPSKTYEKDFCYDVTATSEEEVAPGVWKYGIGLAFQIDRQGFSRMLPDALLSIDLRSRSSIWKTGMLLSNSIGTIDELYTGQVSAVFYHVLPNMPRYKVGDKIGQIKLGCTLPMEFKEVLNLADTARKDNGYGSTGK